MTNPNPKVPTVISKYMASIGSTGGKTKGPAKARTSEQARAAVMARWAKHNKPTPRKKKESK